MHERSIRVHMTCSRYTDCRLSSIFILNSQKDVLRSVATGKTPEIIGP